MVAMGGDSTHTKSAVRRAAITTRYILAIWNCSTEKIMHSSERAAHEKYAGLLGSTRQ